MEMIEGREKEQIDCNKFVTIWFLYMPNLVKTYNKTKFRNDTINQISFFPDIFNNNFNQSINQLAPFLQTSFLRYWKKQN